MIKELGKEIIVSTKKTTLILSNRNQDLLTTEYYGPRIISDSEVSSLIRSYPYNQGTELSLDEKENISLSQNQIKLAISTLNRSNYFSPTQILSNSKSPVFDFRFKKADISVEPKIPDSWVMPHKPDEELIVLLADEVMKAEIEVHYVIYAKEDVIGQYVIIKNNNSLQLNISKCMSLSLCLINNNDIMTSTYGSWIGELSLAKDKVTPGRKVIESLTGSSSARHNPFFMLEEENTNEVSGNVYGFNLVFSGNHEESVEMDSFGNLRIQTGVASAGLDILLEQKEEFVSPMGIMSFSSEGRNGLAFNMQEFVSSHIIPPQWKNKKRPIIYNNWEATGMKFTKAKLISLMKKAKKLGIELFVLDDGWFSTRNDDSHGLGDWECNRKKIPGGLKSLSKSCKDLGMDFGIWMEPEMVNDDTKVYHDHPEWIIHDNLHYPLKGRHQYTLDLSRKEVQDYLFEAISSVLDNKNVSFLKWDYNRNISYIPYSSFNLDYIKGLYSLLRRVTAAYPDVLFENCASGGNRFDLGMLSFFPQSWMSDDTDSFQREFIQGGAIYGYPLSVMSNHVAAKTSNQLLRKTTLDTKFDVASFGVLGYELDLNDLFDKDLSVIKEQIKFYKKHRMTLQFGKIGIVSDYSENTNRSIQVFDDEKTIVGIYEAIAKPTSREGHLKALYLDDDQLYSYQTRTHSFPLQKFGSLVNYVSPVHLKEDGTLLSVLAKHVDMKGETDKGITSGRVFRSIGPVLSQEWSGVGYDERIRLMGDFGSRMYVIEKVKTDN